MVGKLPERVTFVGLKTLVTATALSRSLRSGVRQTMGLGDLLLGEISFRHVDTAGESRVATAGFSKSEICDLFDIAVGNVRQGLSCRPGVSGGHVGHAVVSNSLLNEHRIVMSRRARGLGAAALIDCYVHQDT